MNDRAPIRLRIEPGQTLLRELPPGSRITIVAGEVRVDGPPQWLAETIVRATLIARPGMPITLTRAGWVALSSELGAQVLVDCPERPLSMRAALGALMRGRRRRIGASSPSTVA